MAQAGHLAFGTMDSWLLWNLTGGAVDGGIFFVTGSGLTGVNDNGPIIGFILLLLIHAFFYFRRYPIELLIVIILSLFYMFINCVASIS